MIPLSWYKYEYPYPGSTYLSLTTHNLFTFIEENKINNLVWIIRDNSYQIIIQQTIALYYPDNDYLLFHIDILKKLFDESPIHLIKLKVQEKEIVDTIRRGPWELKHSWR